MKLGVTLVFEVLKLLEDGEKLLFECELLWGEWDLGFKGVEIFDLLF